MEKLIGEADQNFCLAKGDTLAFSECHSICMHTSEEVRREQAEKSSDGDYPIIDISEKSLISVAPNCVPGCLDASLEFNTGEACDSLVNEINALRQKLIEAEIEFAKDVLTTATLTDMFTDEPTGPTWDGENHKYNIRISLSEFVEFGTFTTVVISVTERLRRFVGNGIRLRAVDAGNISFRPFPVSFGSASSA